jgi:hypothetical protein
MARLWLPARAEAAKHAAENNAEARRALEFGKRLKALDPRFECWLQERDIEDLRAGFYYVERKNDDGTVATWEISNSDGSFREPDEQVIEAFRRSDGWSRDVWREVEKGREQQRRRMQAESDRQKQERRSELAERAAFRFRTQVPAQAEGTGRLTRRNGGEW